MPTFQNPAADANEVQEALRALAHATQSIDDPRQIYSVLGSLTSAVASMSQAMHQLAAFHDDPSRKNTWVVADSRDKRAAAHQVSWELHRAGEILHHVADSVGHAHNAEAQITYVHRDFDSLTGANGRSVEPGLGL